MLLLSGSERFIDCKNLPNRVLCLQGMIRGVPFLQQDAVEHLVALRPCGPKIFAIREATADVLYWSSRQEVQISVEAPHETRLVQVGIQEGRTCTCRHP